MVDPSDLAALTNVDAPYETMPHHLAADHPHSQYLRDVDLASTAKVKLTLSNILDVEVTENDITNKVLAFNSGVWRPMDVNDVIATQELPIATETSSGIVRLATSNEVNDPSLIVSDKAVTPNVMKKYVSIFMDGDKFTPTSTNRGMVKIVDGADAVASMITANVNTDPGCAYGTVEQLNINQYVNVTQPNKAQTPAAIFAKDYNGIGFWYAYNSIENGDAAWVNNNATPRLLRTALIPWIMAPATGTLNDASTFTTTVTNISYKFSYYSTFGAPIGSAPAVDHVGLTNSVIYNVYSNGVMSSRTNDYNDHTWINIHEGGAAYDIEDCGTVNVMHEGTLKRYKSVPIGRTTADVTIATWPDDFNPNRLVIQGLAHNVSCSCAGLLLYDVNAYEKCQVIVDEHGHLEYATVEDAGAISCGSGGTIEHVTVQNTMSNATHPDRIGLLVLSGGKGYDITMKGSYARADIQGEAEHIIVNSGCVLDVHGKVKDVVLHAGAYMRLTDTYENGNIVATASASGVIQFPGAQITTDPNCVITGITTGHDPDKKVCLVSSVITYLTRITSNGRSYEVVDHMEYGFHNGPTVSGLSYDSALCMFSANVVTSSGATKHEFTGGQQVQMFSVDMPRGLMRIDNRLADSINRGIFDLNSRNQYIASAYQYQDAKVVQCDKTGMDLETTNRGTNYVISAPDGMYEDLLANTSIVWKVLF